MDVKSIYRKNKDIIAYLFFGICTTLINIVVYWAAAHPLGMGTVFSAVTAWFTAVAFAYMTNRKWLFHSELHDCKEIFKEIIRFFTARLATGILDWICMFIFVDLWKWNDMAVKFATNVIIIILNYLLSKLVVFRKGRTTDADIRIFFEKSIAALMFSLVVIILIIDVFFSDTDYCCKKEFLLPNIGLLSIGVVIVGLIVLINVKWGKNIKIRHESININTMSVLLLLNQCYIFHNIYFASGWDCGNVIRNARMIANGETEGLNNWYFSLFPNNQLLVVVEALIFKVNNAFGIFDTGNGLMFIILVQCLLSAIAGKFLYEIIRDFTKSTKAAWMGWGIYVVLIGLSGWNVITYTDMMGMVFPVLTLRIYQLMQNGKKKWLKWFLVITMSYWGFKMKPTAVIVLIAIVIVELFYCFSGFNKDKIKTLTAAVVIGIASVFMYAAIFHAMIEKSGLQIDPEADTGPLHMVMMGLNSETNGVWYEPDVQLSQSIPAKEERRAAQIEVIKQRMNDYGIAGFLNHMWKKTLVIFNDGSFAWGVEGGFYAEVYDDKNSMAAPFLKSIFYSDNPNHLKLLTAEQMLWITSLFFSPGIAVIRKNKVNSVIVLSIIGIILFNYLFEARARYIMLYVPYVIIAASVSIDSIIKRLAGSTLNDRK